MPQENGEGSVKNIPAPPAPPPALPPPAPPPPAPPPPRPPPPSPAQVKHKFYKKVAESSDPSAAGCEELKRQIRNRHDRFSRQVQWVLYNQELPSRIQEGPQCGLVALSMAGTLLSLEQEVSLDTIVNVAIARGFTAQGEMFSASSMASLAEEVFGCRSELLSGGMEGRNRERILGHLTAGRPVLIPYDEDFNHEPCQREGHRAHWAVISGVLFGASAGSYLPDPDVPGLYHPHPGSRAPTDEEIQAVYLVAKQGKSLRYQLWDYPSVTRSNQQLVSLDPKRASDGTAYVLPRGGLRAGLCGQTILLHPSPKMAATAHQTSADHAFRRPL